MKKKEILPYILILIIVIFLCLISLNTSPLYEGMYHNDSSVFQVLGNGMLKNKTIYKDLFDHKGPIIYIIDAIGILINKNCGLFIIEIIFTYIGSVYIYKTSKIFLKSKSSFLVSIIYLTLIFLYIFGGNFTEEYATNIMSIALYYIVKIIYKKESKKIYWVILGLTFMLNFLIKPTYISIWIAFGIIEFICLIKDKKIKELTKNIIYVLIGMCIVLIPILIYFILTNDMDYFLNAYFITNIKYSNSNIKNKIKAFIILIKFYNYIPFFIISIISNIIMVVVKKINTETRIFVNLFLIISIILCAWAPNSYNHYLLQLATCITLEVMLLFYNSIQMLNKEKILELLNQLPQTLIYISILITIILITSATSSRQSGIFSKEEKKGKELKQFTSEEIKQKINKDDEILVLGNQPYYYIFLDKMPKFKYFFQVPIIKYDENVKIETLQYIKQEKPKLIIKEIHNEIVKVYGEEIDVEIKNNYIEYNEKIIYYVLK